jgi:hypothetical protein
MAVSFATTSSARPRRFWSRAKLSARRNMLADRTVPDKVVSTSRNGCDQVLPESMIASGRNMHPSL